MLFAISLLKDSFKWQYRWTNFISCKFICLSYKKDYKVMKHTWEWWYRHSQNRPTTVQFILIITTITIIIIVITIIKLVNTRKIFIFFINSRFIHRDGPENIIFQIKRVSIILLLNQTARLTLRFSCFHLVPPTNAETRYKCMKDGI